MHPQQFIDLKAVAMWQCLLSYHSIGPVHKRNDFTLWLLLVTQERPGASDVYITMHGVTALGCMRGAPIIRDPSIAKPDQI